MGHHAFLQGIFPTQGLNLGSGAREGGCAGGRRVAGTMEGQSGRCKIVVVGDAECGKTALLQVFAKDAYPGVRNRRLGRGALGPRGWVTAERPRLWGQGLYRSTPLLKNLRVCAVLPSSLVSAGHAHGDLTSLAPHEMLPEILVVPREKTPTGAAARGNP